MRKSNKSTKRIHNFELAELTKTLNQPNRVDEMQIEHQYRDTRTEMIDRMINIHIKSENGIENLQVELTKTE